MLTMLTSDVLCVFMYVQVPEVGRIARSVKRPSIGAFLFENVQVVILSLYKVYTKMRALCHNDL